MRKRNFADGGEVDNPNSGTIWNSIIGAIPSALQGVAGIVGATKDPGNTNVYYGQKNNTGTYIAIGGGILVVIIILVFALKK